MNRGNQRDVSCVLVIASEAERQSVAISNLQREIATPASGGLAMTFRALDTLDMYDWRYAFGRAGGSFGETNVLE